MSDEKKQALKAPKVHGLLIQEPFDSEETSRSDLVPSVKNALRPADKGVDHIDYTNQELKKNGHTVDYPYNDPNGNLSQFDRSKRNNREVYGSTVNCYGQKLYPQIFCRAGILVTDLLQNVPCRLRIDNTSTSKGNNATIPIEMAYQISGANPNEQDPRYSQGNMLTIISRHHHMTATAGSYCVATYMGTEWRPVYLEDSPTMRYGMSFDIGRSFGIDMSVPGYDYYAKYWWWRANPNNKLKARKWD